MAERQVVVDALSAISLFLVAVGGIYLPRFLMKKQSDNKKGGAFGLMFQLGNMLSAGVMLSAGFCHLLATALLDLEVKRKTFPLGPFLAATGYILTLVADELAGSLAGHSHHGESLNHAGSSSKSDMEATVPVARTRNGRMLSMEIDTTKLVTSHTSSDGDAWKQGSKHEDAPSVSFVTALLLGGALSLHSVLEGAALGAQKDNRKAEEILIAILAHKGLAAYALGASLMDSQASAKRFWAVGLGFSVASPLGIFLGYGLSSNSSGAVPAALSALASGTFLYVAMMEVIPKELADPSNKGLKILVMLVGYSAMSLLAIWA